MVLALAERWRKLTKEAEYRLRKYLHPKNIASSSTSAEPSNLNEAVIVVQDMGKVEEVFADFLGAAQLSSDSS